MSCAFLSLRNPLALVLMGGLALATVHSAHAQSVYIFGTGNAAADAAYQSAFSAQGLSPTIGVSYDLFDGSVDLTGFDAVFMGPGPNWVGSPRETPALGQQQLVDFVNGGGGLITAEGTLYTNYVYSGSAYSTLYPILPVSTNAYGFATETTLTRMTSDPIMDAGLPDSFIVPLDRFVSTITESRLTLKTGATAFYSSSHVSGVAVAGWDVGLGRVMSLSSVPGLGNLGNAQYEQLVGNSVRWVVPAPAASALLGLAGLCAARRRR